MNEPVRKEVQTLSVVGGSPLTPMDMLDRALSNNASVEVMERLLSLQERWEKTQARKDFDAAISEAKKEIPAITRNATGHNSKKYADFASIATTVDPILGKHGLSYRFRSNQADRISVTCVLSHRSGHSEETTLTGPADASGNKNAIQAIGSTLTYLQRYSLVQMLGLASAEDDDGKAGAQGETVSDEQVDQISKLLIETKSNLTLFLKTIKLESLTQIRADKFEDAMKLIRDTAAKRAAREGAK